MNKAEKCLKEMRDKDWIGDYNIYKRHYSKIFDYITDNEGIFYTKGKSHTVYVEFYSDDKSKLRIDLQRHTIDPA